MNDIETINPCEFSDGEIVTISPRLNTAFNVLGIMFIVSFLVYVALHCL